MKNLLTACVLAGVAGMSIPARAGSTAPAAQQAVQPAAPAQPVQVGVDEHLGAQVPMDLMLSGEDGRPVHDNAGPNVFAPKVMLVYAWSESLQFNELIERVVKECRKYKVDKLLVENKASGISVAQELRRLYERERWTTQLVNPGNQDKVARLHSVVPIFSNGLVYAPDKAWAEKVITQVSQFPKGRRKDLVDTTSQALRHLRDNGMLELREERALDISTLMTFNGNQMQRLYPV